MVISKPTERIALVAGDGHPQLAQAVADALGIAPVALAISAFADGESRIRLEGDVPGTDLYILQPTSTPTNERLMTLALIADAARGAGARSVTALLPYFGYARQDVRSQPGEPRSAQFAARLLRAAGVDRAVVLELHSPALESAFDMPLIHHRADEPMLAALREWGLAQLTVVSPDAGGLKRAQRYAGALGAALAVVAKTRPAPDQAAAREVLGEVRGRNCLIVDDMASTGNTLVGAADALLRAGAQAVHAAFVHAVMAPGALEHICAGKFERILTTDSVAASLNDRVQVVSIAPLFAQTVSRLSGRR